MLKIWEAERAEGTLGSLPASRAPAVPALQPPRWCERFEGLCSQILVPLQ